MLVVLRCNHHLGWGNRGWHLTHHSHWRNLLAWHNISWDLALGELTKGISALWHHWTLASWHSGVHSWLLVVVHSLLVTRSHLVDLGLDQTDELGDNCQNLRFTQQICHVGICLLIVLEVGLVIDLFLLGLSDFLDFVVVNEQLLSIEWLLVKLSLCL